MDKVEIKQLENSEVEIIVEVPAEEFEKNRAKALKTLGAHVEIPGFRKGHVPSDVLVRHIGEGTLLEEMAEHTVNQWYPKVVIEKKIQAIGQPSITITKLAAGNPLGFKAKTAVVPEVTLPDYKKIGEEIQKEPGEEIVVTDDEVEKAIQQIRENFARHASQGHEHEDGAADEGALLGPDGTPIQSEEKQKKQLPELTDEWVKKLGKFESVEDFKNKIRENLKEEKRTREREKRRAKLVEKLLDESSTTLPELLIAHEQDRMLAQFKDHIALAGMQPDEYFKKSGKKEEDVKTEMRAEAERKVKTQLILAKIAEAEKITVPESEIEKEAVRLREYYRGAPEENIRSYVENILTNEKLFGMLLGDEVKGVDKDELTTRSSSQEQKSTDTQIG
ncbi:MAG: trigger factor [Parcubacteria group bacterium]|nr:trigger factor [Parcubacteria group bacterium]